MVNIECCGVFLEEFNNSILEALMIGTSVAGCCTVLLYCAVQVYSVGMGGRVLRVARMEDSDTVSPSVCRKSPALTHLT